MYSFNVAFEGALIPKRFITEVAGKTLDSLMHSGDVPLKVNLVPIRLIAEVTGKILYTFMHSGNVCLKATLEPKRLITEVTGVFRDILFSRIMVAPNGLSMSNTLVIFRTFVNSSKRSLSFH